MSKNKSSITREIHLSPELDRLIQAPLKDPSLSLPKGIRGDFIHTLIEENIHKWYDLCYGEEFGSKALQFELLNTSGLKYINLNEREENG